MIELRPDAIYQVTYDGGQTTVVGFTFALIAVVTGQIELGGVQYTIESIKETK